MAVQGVRGGVIHAGDQVPACNPWKGAAKFRSVSKPVTCKRRECQRVVATPATTDTPNIVLESPGQTQRRVHPEGSTEYTKLLTKGWTRVCEVPTANA